MKVAFITPWPSQKTGIGDFALDLVSDLMNFEILIHVFTDCEDPVPVNGVEFYNLKGCDLSLLKDYDLRIYQMGNNVHFHLYMLDLIKEYPGIVHLHDMVLHHLMGWITWMQGDLRSYLGLLSKWYGEKVAFLCHELMKRDAMPWDTEVVTDLPLFEEFLQYADACIVNSKFAKNKVTQAFPELPVYRIVHVLKGMEIVEKDYKDDKTPLNIGVFGGIEPNKNVDIILESFSILNHHKSNWHLHIAGEVSDKCKSIPELPVKLGISDKLVFHGRLEDKSFKKHLSEMDLIISLRFPTMGETSGVVTRSMQMGIPVIVTDIGWYAELPAFLDKVPTTNMTENLAKLLLKYFNEKGYLAKKKQEFIQYSQNHMKVDEIVKNYLKILTIEHRRKSNCKIVEIISDIIDDLSIDDDSLIQNTIKKLEIVFN